MNIHTLNINYILVLALLAAYAIFKRAKTDLN